MTDNDIIKAKELLKKLEEAYNAYYDTSKSMPYDIDTTIREAAVCLENAISEINRQKADYLRLEKSFIKNQEIFADQCLENERLKAEIERLNIYANDLLMLLSPKNEKPEAKTYSDVIKAMKRCSCSAMFDALDVTLRDRLVELVCKGIQEFGKSTVKCSADEYIADYLLANGVIVQRGWINALDEIPKEDERVLVKLEDMGYNGVNHTIIDTDRIINGRWVRWSGYVTHWMPLTELLKGEQ